MTVTNPDATRAKRPPGSPPKPADWPMNHRTKAGPAQTWQALSLACKAERELLVGIEQAERMRTLREALAGLEGLRDLPGFPGSFLALD